MDLSDVRFSEVATVGQLEKLLRTALPRRSNMSIRGGRRIGSLRRASCRLLPARLARHLYACRAANPRPRNLRGLRGPCPRDFQSRHLPGYRLDSPALPARLRNRLATAMRAERLAKCAVHRKGHESVQPPARTARLFSGASLFNVFPLPQRSGFLKSFRLCWRSGGSRLEYSGLSRRSDDRGRAIAPFRAGVGLLAKQLNIPVVPMRLAGLFDLRQANRILTRPGHVQVTIGKPVSFSADQDANEITKELERRVREL